MVHTWTKQTWTTIKYFDSNQKLNYINNESD